MYRFITFLLGLVLDLFYRRREEGQAIPTTGPLLIVANHPNGIVDPTVVTRVAGRQVRFMAKEPLFRIPVVGWMLKSAGALPVYRVKDGADTSKNDETFRAVYAALGRKEAVCLFPEGISYHKPQLQPFKTGAARIALAAEAEHNFTLGIRIAPVGLLYGDKGAFRSDIVTFGGNAFDVASHKQAFAEDSRATARALTAQIEEALKELTWNIDAWEDLELLGAIEELLPHDVVDPHESLARLQRLSTGAQQVRALAPERFTNIKARLVSFLARLKRLGIAPSGVDQRYPLFTLVRFSIRNAIALSFGTAISLVGMLGYGIPYWMVRRLPNMLKVETDLVATTRILSSLVLFPLWHSAVTVLLFFQLPMAGAFPLSVALPFCGLYAHHFLRARQRALHDVRNFFAFANRKRLLALLQGERDEIQVELLQLAALIEADSEATAI